MNPLIEYEQVIGNIGRRERPRSRRTRYGRMSSTAAEDDFACKHCKAHVSANPFLSGVRNRNHCPYCLWSRHLDLFHAGDRINACKSLMKPIGLTVKVEHKRYDPHPGELMLIHLCVECDELSINRIAADDIPQAVFGVFAASTNLGTVIRSRLDEQGIRMLTAEDKRMVHTQLFGIALQE